MSNFLTLHLTKRTNINIKNNQHCSEWKYKYADEISQILKCLNVSHRRLMEMHNSHSQMILFGVF